MNSSESWIYQGRQYHGWFGHGTAPHDLDSPPSDAGALFDPDEITQRVAYALSSILGHVPRSDRTRWEAAMADASVDGWARMALAWQAASGLGRDAFRNLFLAPHTNDRLVDAMRRAARGMVEGRTYEALAAAGQDLASVAEHVGVDRWSRFVADTMRRVNPTPGHANPAKRDNFRVVGFAFDGEPQFIHRIADDRSSRILAVQNQILDITKKVLQDERDLRESGFEPPQGFSATTYGTYLHFLFKESVEAANIPGVFVEQSFVDGDDAAYGEVGSVRTDVILRDGIGVLAVWDYKTGTPARMSASRADKIRDAIKSEYGDIPVSIIKVFLGTVEAR